MNKKKVHFIINPISGHGRQNVLENIIPEFLDLQKYDYLISHTSGPGHAIELSKTSANSGKCDIVVAVGGDGSINEVARGLVDTNVPLGIIPTGSGNGLANYLGIPFNFKRAVSIINSCCVQAIDTATINDKLFISIAGVGFDALVAKKFAKVKRRGFWSYLNIVVREYPRYKPAEYIIDINGKTIKTEALLISFANSDQFGFNATISPSASINDGLIDVCIFKKVPVIEAPILANFLFFRAIDETRYIEIIKAKEFKIIQLQNHHVQIDGDPVRFDKELYVKVKPLSLKVITP